jgi:uncharacterized protein YecT (DUF1311 family)
MTPGFAPHPIQAELDRCMESDEGRSTHGQRQCLAAATAAWDRELNQVWKALMSEIDDDPAKEALRAAQRKWIAFRDAEIEALGRTYGAMPGSMYLVMQADSVTTLTRDRVRQLEATLEAWRVSRQ